MVLRMKFKKEKKYFWQGQKGEKNPWHKSFFFLSLFFFTMPPGSEGFFEHVSMYHDKYTGNVTHA